MAPIQKVASLRSPPDQMKDTHATMSINKMLNDAPSKPTKPTNPTKQSQLPTPDISPVTLLVNKISQVPNETQTSPSSISLPLCDPPLYSSDARTVAVSTLFPHIARPRSDSQLSAQSQTSLAPSQSSSSTVEPSAGVATIRNPNLSHLPREEPMPNTMFDLVSIGPENPSDPNGPREAVLRSQAWTNATRYPQQYREMVCRTNAITYSSGEAPALNALADLSVRRLEEADPSRAAHSVRSEYRSTSKVRGRKLKDDFSVPASEPRPEPARPASSRRTRGKKRTTDDQAQTVPPKRQRSEPQKKKKYASFTEILNYCPDVNTEALKAPFPIEQKPNRIDMSKEPQDLLDRMTPIEQMLASNLRLNCNNYLINKRLIFLGKVTNLIDKLPFSKTHAQTSAVIDVNKASQMFSYFAAAGWMEARVLSRFVEEEKVRKEEEKRQKAKEKLQKEENERKEKEEAQKKEEVQEPATIHGHAV